MSQLPGIRQSDMMAYRKCRRYWDFTSGLRRNLTPGGNAVGHFWFGTGMHFALEDYHGYNRFGDPRRAFDAYVKAFYEHELPPDWEKFPELGAAMLTYYLEVWLPRRDTFKTLWVDGKPQVEVNWTLPLTANANMTGTFDRIVTDQYGRIWVWDWKMMAEIDTTKLDNDFQVTTYLWAAEQLYGPVEGMAYAQFRKQVARGPEWLEKSGRFSMAASAPVTYGSFLDALMKRYGRVPVEYQAHLNKLAATEDEDGDALIRRSLVRRNRHAIERQGWNLAAQANEMTFPGLAIYPNPTKECRYCAFRSPCLAADEGSDVEFLLQEGYISRTKSESWKERIVWPEGRGVMTA